MADYYEMAGRSMSLKRVKKTVLEAIHGIEANMAASWAAAAYRRLLNAQWKIAPNPEWFDHRIDLYYQWSARGAFFWLERGCFGSLAIAPGAKILELACGDGFNAKHFYSPLASKVVACDFDPAAISHAKAKNQAANVDFVIADIRTDMPDGSYDNIVWDAAIEHFTEYEMEGILNSIKTRLGETGILSGYTLVEKADGHSHLDQHEYEFKSKEDLLRILSKHFKSIKVFETLHTERHNLYFWCSDGVLPFDDTWPRMVQQRVADI